MPDSLPNSLLSASRADRMKALKHFPALLAEVKRRAEALLADLRQQREAEEAELGRTKLDLDAI